MNLLRALDGLLADPDWAEKLAHVERLPPQQAVLREVPVSLHPTLAQRLAHQGIERLFSHQAEAVEAALEGRDLAVVTGTSSGKTLCYNLPVLHSALTEPAARAFYLFPTKALAQDQVGKLDALAPEGLVRAAVYDGDTPKTSRGAIRRNAHIVLTNPDMLHVGILPSHGLWDKFLRSLRWIVIDEMHAYSGVFGCHVAAVLRRLLRLAEWYGSRPQIIACSATIANPAELFRNLTGRVAHVVDRDGAPVGARTVVVVSSPDGEEAPKRSPNREAGALLAELAEHNIRSMAFCRARVSTELVLRYARRRLEDDHADPLWVDAYRGGYTPKERRELEQALFKGRLRGLATTSAMELGVDVGTLDAVLINGYPGTISGFRQQSGRAGRGGREALTVYLAHSDPLEQYLARDPAMLLQRSAERVAVNPANRYVLGAQLRCAAYERPLAPTELAVFAPNALEVAESLTSSGDLTYAAGRFYYPSYDSPAGKVSIRSIDGAQVQMLQDGEVLATMERWRALRNAHVGAVYLHRGQTHIVGELDVERGFAMVQRSEVDHFTQPIQESVVETLVEIKTRPADPYAARLVGLRVTELVVGYRRMALDGATVLDEMPLDLPSNTYETVGVRLDFPQELVAAGTPEVIGGLHGVEHALAAMASLHAGCSTGDLGSVWYAVSPETLGPCIILYDAMPGGVGLSESLYDGLQSWLDSSRRLLESCKCQDGCPLCLLSARCESSNALLNKPGALLLLQRLQARFAA